MKRYIKIISILLCIGVIINNCIIVSASNNSNDDIVTLVDAVYSRNKTVQGKYCAISIGTPSKTTAFQQRSRKDAPNALCLGYVLF